MSEQQLAGLVAMAGGAIPMMVAVFLGWRTRRFLETAVDAVATVIGNRYSGGGESASYHPIVRFSTREGETVEYEDSLGTNPARYDEGDSVPVKYDPSRPQKARISTGFRLWFAPVLVGGIGAVVLVIGAGLLATG
jgi:hypothetical protein